MSYRDNIDHDCYYWLLVEISKIIYSIAIKNIHPFEYAIDKGQITLLNFKEITSIEYELLSSLEKQE